MLAYKNDKNAQEQQSPTSGAPCSVNTIKIIRQGHAPRNVIRG
jgi:hypothetical protein